MDPMARLYDCKMAIKMIPSAEVFFNMHRPGTGGKLGLLTSNWRASGKFEYLRHSNTKAVMFQSLPDRKETPEPPGPGLLTRR